MNQDWDDAAARRSKMRLGRRTADYAPPLQPPPPVPTSYPNDRGQRMVASPAGVTQPQPFPQHSTLSARLGGRSPIAAPKAPPPPVPAPQPEYTGLRDIHGNPVQRRGSAEKSRRMSKQQPPPPTATNTMGYEQVVYPSAQPLAPPLYPSDGVIDLSTHDIPPHLRRTKPMPSSVGAASAYADMTPLPTARTKPIAPPALANPVTAYLPAPPPMNESMAESTPDDTQPAATVGPCPTCFGAGYLRLDVAVGHPSFGKAIPCNCRKLTIEERRRSDLWRISSLDAFQEMTFTTFNSHITGTCEGWEASQNYAADPDGWIVLSGPCGSGKTHLAAAIANAQFQEGTLVLFTVVPELLDHLRATFAPHSNTTYDALFDKVLDAGMLVLDDLGSENSTPWAQEKLFQIINHRYMYRMPTVITTNLELMNDMDDRIRSRLTDISLVRHVRITGQDYRPRHAPSRQRQRN